MIKEQQGTILVNTITATYVLRKKMTSFILTGGASSKKIPKPIVFKGLMEGNRSRLLICEKILEEESYENISLLMVDGTSFTVYFEDADVVIPAKLLYFKDRPIQIELIPKDMRPKNKRAPRKSVKKYGYLQMGDRTIRIITEDVSVSGLSFWAESRFATKGETVFLKSRMIEIVEIKKVDQKYFYRAKFI